MIIFLLRNGLRSIFHDAATHRPIPHGTGFFLPIASDNYYWILVDCTQMDLNHHQFVLPLNYVCIQWVEILPQPNRRKNYACFFGITKVNTMYAIRMIIP